LDLVYWYKLCVFSCSLGGRQISLKAKLYKISKKFHYWYF